MYFTMRKVPFFYQVIPIFIPINIVNTANTLSRDTAKTAVFVFWIPQRLRLVFC